MIHPLGFKLARIGIQVISLHTGEEFESISKLRYEIDLT